MEIRLRNLSKIFIDKRKNETRAVDNLDIVIPSGKLVGLLGPSGCGKSTLLYMISGLLDPTEGRIFFGSDDVTKLSADKRGIGLVFQNYSLYPHMTVRQNIMFPLENLNVNMEEASERTKEMAALVGIGNLLDRKPAQLSGGQQQRVAIARALVKKPRVLLLDEPLSNLDARLRLQMREEIKRIQRETGITTVFVTHDQEEAMSISDEIIILNYGQEMQKGVPQEIYNKPDNLFVAKFLGNPPINVVEGIVKNNKLIINNQEFLAKNAKDGKYYVGIRPESFNVGKEGYLVNNPEVEVIGRDTMIRFNFGDKQIRALVQSEDLVDSKEIRLTVKDQFIHLFDMESELTLDVLETADEELINKVKNQIERRNKIEESEKNRKS